MRKGFIYILASKRNGTLYTGVTSNLIKRVFEHKHNLIEGFTSKYYCKILVYFEVFDDITYAIQREKQIKNYPRKRKLFLIESTNLDWEDLYSKLF